MTVPRAIDALIRDLYAAISFGPGESPDVDRLRTLFEDGRLVHVRRAGSQHMGVDQFIHTFKEQVRSGALRAFSEREMARTLEVYGDIAHVMSTYEARINDEDRVHRGKNSIQLIRGEHGWRVFSLIWCEEEAGA